MVLLPEKLPEADFTGVITSIRPSFLTNAYVHKGLIPRHDVTGNKQNGFYFFGTNMVFLRRFRFDRSAKLLIKVCQKQSLFKDKFYFTVGLMVKIRHVANKKVMFVKIKLGKLFFIS